jgi:glycosyltransferase involved in cell wall biosynthesis
MTVSIITPVYNVEPFIRVCLDSIVRQSYKDFEVILIDDGSSDQSGSICDEYVRKDNRFKAFHYENSGVSMARQRGLEHASGDYVIHIDPDDWVDPDMLSALVGEAERTGADYVICDYWENGERAERYVTQNPGEDLHANVVMKKMFLQLHGACWNKFIRRRCCENVRFSPTCIVLHEDVLFNIRVLSQDLKVIYLPRAFYHYRINSGASLCHTYSMKHIRSGIAVVSEFKKIIQSHDYLDESLVEPYKVGPIFFALMNRKFRLMKHLYPEIHSSLIETGKKYRLFAPRGGCVSLALRGYPLIAYCLYKSNVRLINSYQYIRRIVRKCISKS